MISGILICLIFNLYYESDAIGDLDVPLWQKDLGWDGLMVGVGTGFIGFTVYSFWVIGYQMGEATLVGWLEYIQIPISFVYQLLIFDDVPNKYEIIGAVAVGIGGLLPTIEQVYIYLKERSKGYQQIDITSDVSESEIEISEYAKQEKQ